MQQVISSFDNILIRGYSSSMDYAEMSAKIREDFSKLNTFEQDEISSENQVVRPEEEKEIGDSNHESSGDQEEEEEEFEFSFVCTDHDGSPISADDIFRDGQIRSTFPLFNRDLLVSVDKDSDPSKKKVSVEECNMASSSSSSSPSSELKEISAPYCEWSKKSAASSEASMQTCKKSNSTGFSRRWRFRDLIHRSSSDGKETFVFLNHPTTTTTATTSKTEKNETTTKGKARGGGTASSSGAHENYLKRNRAQKDGDRRRSYLTYRPVVGFFSNSNGLSKNIHPF